MRLRSLLIPMLAALALVLTACGGGNVFELEAGQCFDDTDELLEGGEIDDVPVVECSEPHDNEVYAVFDLEDGEFPGQSVVQSRADDGCLDRFEDFVGIDYASSRYVIANLVPTEESWGNGDREVVCFLYDIDFEKLTGSAEGTAE